MPIYTHVCGSCGNEQDEQYSIKEDPTVPCSVCEQPTRRKIVPANFVLHGDCWAKDGYGVSHKKL